MYAEKSIKRQLQRETNFIPPYCPNHKCSFHSSGHKKLIFFHRHGTKKLKRFPYLSYRFRCKKCRRSFASSYFRLDYKEKYWGFNEQIWNFHRLGVSKREIGRILCVSEHLVRIRLSKMAQWSLLKHAKLIENLKISEPIVYDGLENFSFSQYDPNNINHAIGKDSLFTYDFNFCPINRKGRMSERQVKRKKILEKVHGCYPIGAIRTSTTNLLRRLEERSEVLLLYTDCHFQYKRSINIDLKDKKIKHIRISSKIARNYKNHLFAVNNIDLQARHNLAAFKRETIAFSKHSIAMVDSFILYFTYRNYMRPKFWGTHRSDPFSSKKSPAMELKITRKILNFKDFFKERVPKTHVNVNQDWKNFIERIDLFSRRTIALSA